MLQKLKKPIKIRKETNLKSKDLKAKLGTIVVVCAHNDDQIIGLGGTIKKYIKQGYEVHTYIFSYGETSHPHLKRHVIIKTRIRESLRASKILGDQIHYFGVKEGRFLKDFNVLRLEKVIREKKPLMVFTHSPDDPHPDHRAVFNITKKTLEKLNFKGEMYSFNIWNFFPILTRNYPKLFVDVSDEFKYKINAFNSHKSQFTTMLFLGWSIYLKAIIAGWNNHCKYAEVFYRIKLNTKK